MKRTMGWFAAAAVFLVLLLLCPVSGLPGEAARPAGAEHALYRMLGVFRVFAVDALWMRMGGNMSAGRDGLVLSDARTLLSLEPGSDEIRDFLHWHLAFNMANRAVGEASRAQWFEEGLDVQEEGLRIDPDSAVLNFGLGKTLFMLTVSEDNNWEIHREVCLRRYGRPPELLAHIYLEKAYERSGDLLTLQFLLQALANAADLEGERGRHGAAAELWAGAARHAAEGFAEIRGDDEVEDMIDGYRAMEEKTRGLDSGPKPR